jgi:Pyridoxamine 5'-phosphate oxidase
VGFVNVTASMAAPLRGRKRWAYLARGHTIRIATLNDDGSIYLSPLWFLVDDQRIFIVIDAASKHGVNFEAGRALAGLVDSGDEFGTVHGVRILGTTKVVDDPELHERLEQMLRDKYFYVDHPYMDAAMEFGHAAGRRYFELIPSKMIGWDLRETTQAQAVESRELPEFFQDRLVR